MVHNENFHIAHCSHSFSGSLPQAYVKRQDSKLNSVNQQNRDFKTLKRGGTTISEPRLIINNVLCHQWRVLTVYRVISL